MKRLVLATLAVALTVSSFSQDSTQNKQPDTVRIGGITIIKKADRTDSAKNQVSISSRRQRKNSNLQTNWWIVDLGFANYDDKTNYLDAQTSAFAPQMNKDDLKLRTGKSVNVNIWPFMQRLNLVKRVINLKYGIGVELNNYHFDDNTVQFLQDPTMVVKNAAWKDVKKNKLAADYLTVPLLLNINFTPGRSRGFGFSGGISGGYLYSARQKIKMGGDKDKSHDDFDLRKWKVSYLGELSLGPVRLYGSYANRSMFEKGLDLTPYNFGLRISRF